MRLSNHLIALGVAAQAEAIVTRNLRGVSPLIHRSADAGNYCRNYRLCDAMKRGSAGLRAAFSILLVPSRHPTMSRKVPRNPKTLEKSTL